MRTNDLSYWIVALAASSVLACGPGRANDSDSTQTSSSSDSSDESASEDGSSDESGPADDLPPEDLPPEDPPCAEIEAIIELEDQRLCSITATGRVLTFDETTQEVVISELDQQDLVELTRFDPGAEVCGFLVHEPGVDRMWVSTRDQAFDAHLHTLDDAGMLLDSEPLVYDTHPVSWAFGHGQHGQLILGARFIDATAQIPDRSFLQARDADGNISWTQLDYASAETTDAIYSIGKIVGTDTSLAFLGYISGIDSSRVSLHMVDDQDGALRWNALATVDNYEGPYHRIGARTASDGNEWVYLSELDWVDFTFGQDPIDPGVTSLTAYDITGTSAWTTTIEWPQWVHMDATGVQATDDALYEAVVGEEEGTGNLRLARLVQRDLDGETVCIERLEELDFESFQGFELIGPDRAVFGTQRQIFDGEFENIYTLVILRLGLGDGP